MNLREIVRTKLVATHEADPGVIAEKVLADLDPADHFEALEQTMRPFVRETIRESRMRHHTDARIASDAAHEALGDSGSSDASTAKRAPGKSWRVAAKRAFFEAQLDDPFHVGKTEWKLLRDCTAENLHAMAEERRAKAAQNAAWAKRFDDYAEAVERSGVSTFGELPPDVLAELLKGA